MKKDKATGGIRLRIMNYVTGGITLVIAVLMLATTFRAIADYNSLRHTSEAFVEVETWRRNAVIVSSAHVQANVGAAL